MNEEAAQDDPGKLSGPVAKMMVVNKPCRDCGLTFEIAAPVNADGAYSSILLRQERCRDCVDRKLRDAEDADRRLREASLIFRRKEMLGSAGIPPKFLTDAERLEGFKPEGNEASYETVLEYTAHFPLNERPVGYPSLLLYSRNNGIGKTRLVCGVMRHLIESWERDYSSHSAYKFVAMPDLRLQLQMGLRFQAEQTSEAVYANCKNAWLLVLDDVGKESQFRADDADVYFKLINDRYNQQLPIIITSNLPPDKPWVKGGLSLADIMGLATMSRLKEMCKGKVVEIKGEDRR